MRAGSSVNKLNVLQVYNEQRSQFGGERSVIDITIRVLAEHGHEPRLIMKSSRDLENSVVKRINAFWGGVFNILAFREMRKLIEKDRPDVVHIHNVYPMFSPSILVACRRAGLPIVMTVHSQILTCPTWYHLYKGQICEECLGGHEYRCVLKNCRANLSESTAYALRSFVARRFRLFHDNVSMLIVQTAFSKAKLVAAGFREDQIRVVPNPTSVQNVVPTASVGEYVAFSGRLSLEKGIDVFLAAAAQLPEVPFKVAGDGPAFSEMRSRAPRNVEFVGKLGFDHLVAFYRKCRLLVVPSVCFETFGMVAVDAMALGVPIIASRIGGLPHLVDEGSTGLLFDPGNSMDLAQQVRRLWDNPQLCNRFGQAGRRKVMREYTEEIYFKNLIAVYETAMQRSVYRQTDTQLVHIKSSIHPSGEMSGS